MSARFSAFLLGLLVAVFSLFVAPYEASAQGVVTYSQALAQCQSEMANASASYGPYTCQESQIPNTNICYVNLTRADGLVTSSYSFGCSTYNSCTAKTGATVPPGTSYQFYESIGESCSGGCEMALSAGTLQSGSWSGGGNYVYNGSACAATGSATNGSLTKPSQTLNADGSTTFCDPISGKCVTTKGASTSPASSSSSGNHSTDSNSVTDNPATSSSTTTTTTTTGTGGSGDSGSGTGSSTSVSSGKTDNPASASSTASKCTTGVCDVGDADGDPGQLYQASTDTMGSVYATFEQQMSNAPIISAVSGFFTVTASGQCPTWHIPGNQYWGAGGFDFTFFCDSAVLAIMTLAGYVVLATAAFCAIRIAIY